MALDKKTESWLEANASPSVKGKTVLITGATGGERLMAFTENLINEKIRQ
ncbi:MAG: hypothetical protein IKI68_02620 [Clostridia bacterium]|nr:hypothetical protein [Clostridia bacterium]